MKKIRFKGIYGVIILITLAIIITVATLLLWNPSPQPTDQDKTGLTNPTAV